MAKKRRSLTDVFDNVMGAAEREKQEEKQEEQEEKTPEVKEEKEENTQEAKEPELEPEPTPQEEDLQDNPPPQETQEEQETQQESEQGLITKFKKKKEQKKVEDTHTRETFLVRNDLKKELDKLFKKYGYGFKTLFINEAIERQLELVKEEEARHKRK